MRIARKKLELAVLEAVFLVLSCNSGLVIIGLLGLIISSAGVSSLPFFILHRNVLFGSLAFLGSFVALFGACFIALRRGEKVNKLLLLCLLWVICMYVLAYAIHHKFYG